jgi:hypothetical protein
MQACMQELLNTIELCDCGFTSNFFPTPHFKSFFNIKQILSPHENGKHKNMYINIGSISNYNIRRKWYAFIIANCYQENDNIWFCDEITTNYRNCRENMVNLSGNYLI